MEMIRVEKGLSKPSAMRQSKNCWSSKFLVKIVHHFYYTYMQKNTDMVFPSLNIVRSVNREIKINQKISGTD